MTVQAKLIIYAITALAAALVLASMLFLIAQQMAQSSSKINVANAIAQEATELNTLTYDYMLHSENRPAQQWTWVHTSLGKQLDTKAFEDPRDKGVLEQMIKNHSEMKVTFADLVRLQSDKVTTSSELQERLSNQLLIHSREIVSDSFQLANLNLNYIEQVQQRATFAVAIFIIVLTALMIGIIILTNTSIAQPLMKAQERLKEAQAVSHVGSWEWDIPQNKLVWSDEMYKTYGYTPQEFDATFEKAMERVIEEDKKRITQDVSELLKNPQPGKHQIPGIDYTIVMPDKSKRVLHGESSLLVNENGKPIRLTGVVQDVTQSHAAQTELERRADELTRMNKLMTGRELKMIEMKKELEEIKK